MANLNLLTRRQLEDLFEHYGFAVYAHESTEMLRASLRVNIEDGTIPEEEVEECLSSR